MKFKLDENFGFRSVQLLTEAGHDVHTVLDEDLSGANDQAIFRACMQEGRCLLTLDLDFTDVTRFPPHESAGIAVLRFPRNPSLGMIESLVWDMLKVLRVEEISGRLWILEPGRIRFHDDTSNR